MEVEIEGETAVLMFFQDVWVVMQVNFWEGEIAKESNQNKKDCRY